MHPKLTKIILVCQIFATIPAQSLPQEHKHGKSSELVWTHHIELADGFQFKWSSVDETWITMEMSAPTKGYLGIGFSPSGGMPGSDIALGWVDDTGKAHFKDYHGTKNGAPIVDEKQDYELLDAKENEDGTSFIFRRKWDTCDDKNDMILGDDTIRLIWAWHNEDPKDNQLHWHGLGSQRGTKSAYLKVQPKPKYFPDDDPSIPESTDVKTWDSAMENFLVPNVSSYYHCKIFKFPSVSAKHHIIGYRPLIIPEHVPYIHHINIYRCLIPGASKSLDDVFGKYIGSEGQDCVDPKTPKSWVEYCFTFILTHSLGSEGDMFPDHLGLPIGEETENMYMRLEVHYENPDNHFIVDSSGLRMFYSPELREHDMAMMFLGYRRTPFLSLPPFQSNFQVSGNCPSECTQLGIPKGGIKFFRVLLHAHLSGRKLRLRHIREGKELPVIAEDNAYDFKYQEYRILPEDVLILPGDELIMECDMNTEERSNFTLGGLTSKNEMCEAFIHYYPKATLVDCRSQPELYSYLEALGIHNVTGDLLDKLHLPYEPDSLPGDLGEFALIDDSFVMNGINLNASLNELYNTLKITSGPEDSIGNNLMDYMESMDWKDGKLVGRIEEAWKVAPKYSHCAAPEGRRIKQKNHISPISKFEPLPSGGSLRKCTN